MNDNTSQDDNVFDFILGLDMLKRHGCQIDLVRNMLVIIPHSGFNILNFSSRFDEFGLGTAFGRSARRTFLPVIFRRYVRLLRIYTQQLFECYTASCEIYAVEEEDIVPQYIRDAEEHDFDLDGWTGWQHGVKVYT
mmetsp:Transcript_2641/g.4016  ORF Transcript_2641/g.4016 Transcript_2641/m.4016 type:complete len:136 (+) Transcript_2641:612-1019(+)